MKISLSLTSSSAFMISSSDAHIAYLIFINDIIIFIYVIIIFIFDIIIFMMILLSDVHIAYLTVKALTIQAPCLPHH